MDETERTVHQYLSSLQMGEVRYEPDGNVPPDFLVGGRIAVEARRLNEHEDTDSGPRGLEITAKPLQAAIIKALRQSGPPENSRSWYVHYTVRRPLPPWRELERSLCDAVEHFRQRVNEPPAEMRIGRSIRLKFTRAGREYDRLLVLGSSSDHDSGGFVVAELLRNLRICIADKASKIAPVRSRYQEWWLAFDDRIAYCAVDSADLEDLRYGLGDVPRFSRVLLIDPLKPTKGLDLLQVQPGAPKANPR